jgi:hypothetical protein
MDNSSSDIVSLDGSWLDDRFEEDVELSHWHSIYPTLTRKPLRLSHSTLNLFNSCERKFQRLKLQNIQNQDIYFDSKKNNVNLDYGSAFGIGIQTYIITQSLEQAIWETIKSYNFANESAAKNALSLVAGIQAFAAEWDADFWEIAYFNGKPAAEVSFKIILDEATQDYYCGYIDLVLKNKLSGLHVIIEIKTTGLKLEDIRPLYRNSGQALGYSIVLDSIAGSKQSAWEVLYLVNQLKAQNILPKIHLIPFDKHLRDRLSWLLDMKIDHERILQLLEMDHWPMRGGSCLAWSRPCPIYGICDLVSLEAPDAMIRPEEEWDFIFTLEELIERAA